MAREKLLQLRLTEEEKQTIEANAGSVGQRPAPWLRSIALGQRPTAAPAKPAHDPPEAA
ncbi:MAG: plasmid mobilization protein [Bryobacteraceae bacterium]